MPGTRSSARQAAKASASPASAKSNDGSAAGAKRKASPDASPTAKKSKTSESKGQTTIEESMHLEKKESVVDDTEMKDTTTEEPSKTNNHENQAGTAVSEEKESREEEVAKREEDGLDNGHAEKHQDGAEEKAAKEPEKVTAGGEETAVEKSAEREKSAPSNVLEKGLIYFFFRGRVGINEPNSVADVARSYIVLRPLAKDAKLGEGAIGDDKNNRLLALPKKVLPKSPKDRFMTFVEKGKCSMDEIKETLSSSDYTTQTMGDRHTPSAAPIGEGVYALTQTGKDTHLAYMLTLPSELSDVQKDIGLNKRGSYFTSAKNPKSSGPASAQLPQSAEFPAEIQDQFNGRSWLGLQPEMLNYENAQFLLIGHGDGALEKATQAENGDDKNPEKKTALEEVEMLEHEDEIRVNHLEGDDSVFADLGLTSEEYPKLQTTW